MFFPYGDTVIHSLHSLIAGMVGSLQDYVKAGSSDPVCNLHGRIEVGKTGKSFLVAGHDGLLIDDPDICQIQKIGDAFIQTFIVVGSVILTSGVDHAHVHEIVSYSHQCHRIFKGLLLQFLQGSCGIRKIRAYDRRLNVVCFGHGIRMCKNGFVSGMKTGVECQ